MLHQIKGVGQTDSRIQDMPGHAKICNQFPVKVCTEMLIFRLYVCECIAKINKNSKVN